MTKVPNLFNCFGCDKMFVSSQDVGLHVEKDHSFECDQCSKIMASKTALNDHTKEHTVNVDFVEKAQYFDELSQMCAQLQAQLESDCDTSSNGLLSDDSLGGKSNEVNAESYFYGDETMNIVEQSFNGSDSFSDTSIALKEEKDVNVDMLSSIKEEAVFDNISFSDQLNDFKDTHYNNHQILFDAKQVLFDKNNANHTAQNIDGANLNMDPENDNVMKIYDWSHEDRSVPLGWMTVWDKVNNLKRFLSPKGKFFGSRVEAISYMAQQGTQESQINEMKEGLLSDGWNSDDNLPEGWYVWKVHPGNIFFYFTDDNVLLESAKSASEYMEQSDRYGKVEIDNLWKMCSISGKGRHIKNETEFIKDDEMVPKGWYRKVNIRTDNDRRVYFKTPNGDTIVGTINALKYMRKNNYSDEDINIVKQNLLEDGWKVEDFLPEGWYIKNRRTGKESEYAFSFLTNEFKIFKSYKMVGEFLKNFGQLGKETNHKIYLGLEQLKKSFRKNIIMRNDGQYELPSGWQLNIGKRADTSHMYYFMAPNGTKITGLIHTLQYMKRENYSNDDIQLIVSYLQEEGWKFDKLLPTGWFMRENKKDKSSYNFLTNDFELIRSSSHTMDHLKKYYTEEDILKFSTLIRQVSVKGSEERWKWAESKENIPNGWKIRPSHSLNSNHFVISPNGLRFDAIRLALKYMVENNYNEKDIEMLSKHLIKEKWEQDEKLPPGWYFKRTFVGSSKLINFDFLTIEFKLISSIKNVIEYLENSSLYNQETIKLFLEKIEEERKCARKNLYESEGTEDPLPTGWKMRKIVMKDGRTRRFFLSPDGDNFTGVIQALQYVVKNDYSLKDIEVLSLYLIKDGWNSDELLPKGWFMKVESKMKGSSFKYLTAKFEQIPTNTTALDFIKNDSAFTTSDEQNFLALLSQKSSKSSDDRWVWTEDNESVPNGWKIRSCPTDQRKHFIKSPDGVQFVTFRQSLQHMVENNYSEKDIQVMAQHLKKEGWERHEFLPEGWYMKPDSYVKKGQFNYLTDVFEFIRSNTLALDSLKNNVRSTEEDIKKFMTLVNQNSVKGSEERWNWNEGDDIVPDGWKIKKCPTDSKMNLVMSPNGLKFGTIRKALEYMVGNSFSKEDIHIMAKHVIKEGWEKNDLLPNGWYMKSIKNQQSSKLHFLSDEFKAINSSSGALDELKNNGKFTNDEIQNFIMLLKQNSLKECEERWNWNEGDEKVPDGWKIKNCPTDNRMNLVMSPTGLKFGTIRKALEYMVKHNYKEEHIEIMAKHIIKEGWQKHDLLPKGWYMKFIQNGKYGRFDYLSDAFIKISSTTTALYGLKNNGKSTFEEIQNFISLVNQNSSKNIQIDRILDEMNDQVLDGWKIQTCPTNNRRNYVVSPSGLKFNTIRQSLEYMAENDYEIQDIDTMAKHLIKDGWEKYDLLPNGWHLKREKNGNKVQFSYLSADFKFIRSNTAALDVLRNNGKSTEEDIQNFMIFVNQNSAKGREERWNCNESNDIVPKGWKIKKCPTDNRMNLVMSDTGVKFGSIRKALEYMVENGYSREDIDVMTKHIIKEGWMKHELLPKGWHMKSTKYYQSFRINYLSDSFKPMTSNSGAIEELKNNGRSTNDEIQNFISLIKQNSLKESEGRSGWKEDNEIIPEGWKIRKCPTDNRMNLVISPTGLRFQTIRKALEYMVKNNYSKGDVDTMAKHITTEGWKKHDLLPNGWYMKSIGSGHHFNFYYLSDAFIPIHSDAGALDELKNNGKSTSDEIKNFILLTNQNFSEKSKEKYTWSDSDGTVPKDWKMRTNNYKHSDRRKGCTFMPPDGRSLTGRVQALQYMISNGYSQKEIQNIREGLSQEGWSQHPTLPKNWLTISYQNSHELKVISPSGQQFRSMKAILEYMKETITDHGAEEDIDLKSTKRKFIDNPNTDEIKKKIKQEFI